jgi:hypothetical protein
VSVRLGVSWPLSGGRRAWLSAPLWAWLAGWLLLLPFIAAWLALKLLVAAARGIVWLATRVHEAPAVPPRLKTPPRRG